MTIEYPRDATSYLHRDGMRSYQEEKTARLGENETIDPQGGKRNHHVIEKEATDQAREHGPEVEIGAEIGVGSVRNVVIETEANVIGIEVIGRVEIATEIGIVNEGIDTEYTIGSDHNKLSSR